MATEVRTFAGDNQDPYVAPVGWTIHGELRRFIAYGSGEINGDPFGQMTFNAHSSGMRTITAPMRWNSVGASSEWGFCAINAERTGFSLIVKNAATTLRKEVAGAGGATIATLSTTNTADATFSMDFNDATGLITVRKNGTTVLTGTYTDTPNLKIGIQSYNGGTAQSYSSVTVDYTPAQTVGETFVGLPDQVPIATLPVGWLSVGQVAAKRFAGAWASTSNANAIWVYNKPPVGLLTSEIVLGTINSTTSRGIAFCDAAGNGYVLLVRSGDARLFRNNAGVLGTQVGATYTGSFAINDVVRGTLNTATGAFVFHRNSVQFATFTDTTYSSDLLAGIMSRDTGGDIKSVTLSDYNLQFITSINSGNPITAGQTGIPIEATGFTAKPTSVTVTYASGTKSITATVDSGGTSDNFNISIQDRIEAEDWPANGDTPTFTFTYGSESASGTQTLVKKAGETVLTFAGAITSDPATLTYWLTQDGFTVEGGENVYEQPPATGTMPAPNLVLTAYGGGSVKEACTFNSWWRPATGTGAGNVYPYTWVASAAGISVSIPPSKFAGSKIKGSFLAGSYPKGKLL